MQASEVSIVDIAAALEGHGTITIADDPGLRERMGKANRERSAAYYTH
ncbi:MAG: hypothetical protein ABSA97_02175 [Verrucomicrobiia bacterium]